jgi:hypothetical protein
MSYIVVFGIIMYIFIIYLSLSDESDDSYE